jgi:nucleoside-diphosphate-sugar epimerase
MSEKTALYLGGELGVPTVVLRPCMVYGVGGEGEFYKMCRMMKKGFFPKVGSGKNLTPLVHVRDLVQVAISAADRGAAGQVYIIASERSLALDELREMVMQAWGTRAFYPYVPVWFMYCVAFGFELRGRITGKAPVVTRRNIASTVWDREFSISKAKQELGYVQTVDFIEGINETVNWYKALLLH